MNVESEVKTEMNHALEYLKQDLKSLRTGRANPALLDPVTVEVYGTKMRLKELANITVPESRQLLVTPFDQSNLQAIRKGIENANLNLQPIADKNQIRINIPPMDTAIRENMVKECKKKGESSKVAIREIRRKFNEIARKQKASGEITEDTLKHLEKMIQDQTDANCKKVDLCCKDKEVEILQI